MRLIKTTKMKKLFVLFTPQQLHCSYSVLLLIRILARWPLFLPPLPRTQGWTITLPDELEELRHSRKQSSKERQADAAEEGRALRNKIRDLEEEIKTKQFEIRDLEYTLAKIEIALVIASKARDLVRR